MSDAPRYTLNRTVVLLVPREPFLEWLNGADPADDPLTAEDLRDDSNVFLIPQFSDDLDTMKWIEKRWNVLFEHMLLEWMADEAMWPDNLTLEMFREWFDIEIHTMVWDLAQDEFLLEDWQDEDDAGDDDDGREGGERIVLH